MGYGRAISFYKSVCGNLRKDGKETAARQTVKKIGAKNLFIKKYFKKFINYGCVLAFK